MTKKQDDKHADEVGDEEGRAAVVVRHVREPPNIPQPHSVAHHGEDEVKPVQELVSDYDSGNRKNLPPQVALSASSSMLNVLDILSSTSSTLCLFSVSTSSISSFLAKLLAVSLSMSGLKNVVCVFLFPFNQISLFGVSYYFEIQQ